MARASTRITFILGCTGGGKGATGRALAKLIGAEIVSVDSMKVYKRMDIGTAKPTAEQRLDVPHHLLDVVEPSEEYSVAQFVGDAERAIADITARGKHVLCVGGTALYIKSLSEGLFDGPSANDSIRNRLRQRAEQFGTAALHSELCRVDPEAGDRIHPNDLRRIVRALEVYELTGRPISELQTQWDRNRTVYDCVFLGLRREKEEENRRCNARIKRMVEAGLVDEVRSLWLEKPPISSIARQALGYAEIIEYLEGRVILDDAIENIKINTRKFSKAQRTWFKRFRQTEWIDVTEGDTADGLARRLADMEKMPWSK